MKTPGGRPLGPLSEAQALVHQEHGYIRQHGPAVKNGRYPADPLGGIAVSAQACISAGCFHAKALCPIGPAISQTLLRAESKQGDNYLKGDLKIAIDILDYFVYMVLTLQFSIMLMSVI